MMTKTHILGGVVDYGSHTEGVCSQDCWCLDLNKMNKIQELMDMSIDDLQKRESVLWETWSKVKKVIEIKQMLEKEMEVDANEE